MKISAQHILIRGMNGNFLFYHFFSAHQRVLIELKRTLLSFQQ